ARRASGRGGGRFRRDAARANPLLVGHSECPGFTGPPLGSDAWRDILVSTAALQYPADVTPL
ncbi:MAG: hypothetical protein AB7T37_06990, partial [Dehalococcoidia bacterium]